MQKPLHIAVLMGGTSSEREVSFMSGTAIEKALRKAGHIVERVEINTEDLSEMDSCKPDVAFIALHGKFGEDGRVQKLLEERGIPYTGSGPVSSNIAMNKVTSKAHFLAAGIPTPTFATVLRSQTLSEITESVVNLGLPVVVKPVKEGSSIGVSIVRNLDQLLGALEEAFKYGNQVMIEEFIGNHVISGNSDRLNSRGREFTVGILGNEPLPIIELIPNQEFYNYEAKYIDHSTKYVTDVQLDETLYKEMQTMALRAHNALGCAGFSRVDFMACVPETSMDVNGKNLSKGDAGIYVLEVNTIPGFTEYSLLPKAAAAAGISFVELCERVVQLSLDSVVSDDTKDAISTTPLSPVYAG